MKYDFIYNIIVQANTFWIWDSHVYFCVMPFSGENKRKIYKYL